MAPEGMGLLYDPRVGSLRNVLLVFGEEKVTRCEKIFLCPTALIPKARDCIFFLSGCNIAQKVAQGQLALLSAGEGGCDSGLHTWHQGCNV